MNPALEKSVSRTTTLPHRVHNFGAGPSTLPLPVLKRIQEEMLDFAGLGASVIEVSHRSSEFMRMAGETREHLRRLMNVPASHSILFAHGGGHMQFSAVPLNLLGLKPSRKALYVDTGNFALRAIEDAGRQGYIRTIASGRNSDYDRIPELNPQDLDPDACYLHITTNNTAMGTRWNTWPDSGNIPLVGDMTSDILSRHVDVNRFGLIYASAQKNVGIAGAAVVIVRKDLLGHALPDTPNLLNYQQLDEDNSLTNTVPTFTIYVMKLLLEWLEEQGGLEAMEAANERKAKLLYDVLDRSAYYRAYVQPAHRSTMNVTFTLPDNTRLERFLAEAHRNGLYALKGHSFRGGVRASIYNAMTEAGVRALADFMTEFERRNG